ncbi:MAG: arginyltransferase [Sulfurimonas sp.]
MNLLKEFLLEDKCSYLDNKKQTTHYKVIDACSAKSCQELIERGYRRFGKMYFRPICAECEECQSIKIDVENYTFSKSAKRVLKKAKDLSMVTQHPTMTKEHLELFNKYHKHMNNTKGWDYSPTSAEHYFNSFVNGHEEFGYEVLYFFENKLVGVDLIDILDDGISSIYFYYDPDFANYSLGRLSLYKEIEFAKENGKKWIYLGYYVEGCPSLQYKANYKPYLTLQGRPSEYEKYEWQ